MMKVHRQVFAAENGTREINPAGFLLRVRKMEAA